MAKVVKGDLVSAGRPRKYPWEEWLDGRTWELTRGEDFTSNALAFRNQIYTRARDFGKLVSVTIVDDDTLRMQGRPR